MCAVMNITPVPCCCLGFQYKAYFKRKWFPVRSKFKIIQSVYLMQKFPRLTKPIFNVTRTIFFRERPISRELRMCIKNSVAGTIYLMLFVR